MLSDFFLCISPYRFTDNEDGARVTTKAKIKFDKCFFMGNVESGLHASHSGRADLVDCSVGPDPSPPSARLTGDASEAGVVASTSAPSIPSPSPSRAQEAGTEPPSSAPASLPSAPHTLIQKFGLIAVEKGLLFVTRGTISCNSEDGIRGESGAVIKVEDCSIKGHTSCGLRITGFRTLVSVSERSVVSDNLRAGLVVSKAAKAVVDDCRSAWRSFSRPLLHSLRLSGSLYVPCHPISEPPLMSLFAGSLATATAPECGMKIPRPILRAARSSATPRAVFRWPKWAVPNS